MEEAEEGAPLCTGVVPRSAVQLAQLGASSLQPRLVQVSAAFPTDVLAEAAAHVLEPEHFVVVVSLVEQPSKFVCCLPASSRFGAGLRD